jgi:hypothetical protein
LLSLSSLAKALGGQDVENESASMRMTLRMSSAVIRVIVIRSG